MPFAVGGGITTNEQIQKLISAGAEKVILGESAATHPEFVKRAVEDFGSSTISVCIDVKKPRFGKTKVYYRNGAKPITESPLNFAKRIENMGAGEIILQSINQDGMMQGYDINLTKEISQALTIPVVALGGAGELKDLGQVFRRVRQRSGRWQFICLSEQKTGCLDQLP